MAAAQVDDRPESHGGAWDPGPSRHMHRIPGIWDDDNGPIAGHVCRGCRQAGRYVATPEEVAAALEVYAARGIAYLDAKGLPHRTAVAARGGPRRVQLRRTKGWRKPADAVVVARPSRWGNPFGVGADVDRGQVPTRDEAVRLFRDWVTHPTRWNLPAPPDLGSLRGRDLACWCPLDQPCHADVLLEHANKTPEAPQ